MPNYGDPEYWENRYSLANGKTFDWLEDYNTLKSIISDLKLSKRLSKVINLGCGNSIFCEDMYDDGYHNILNIDIAKNVIDVMKKRNYKRPIMQFKQMDVRKLQIESNSYDLAIDKSTIDALLCGEESFVNVARMINEVQRILKVNGYYMIISYGPPENRMIHLEREFLNFDISIYTIKKDDDVDNDKTHYIYLCKKLRGADELSQKYFSKTIETLQLEDKIEEETMKNAKIDIINHSKINNEDDIQMK